MRICVAVLLVGFGVYRIISKKHPRFGGMQVGFRDLTIWSFLMASAHGAGFMLLPILLGMSAMNGGGHEMHANAFPGVGMQLLAVAIHTVGYLLLTGAIAWVVYKRVGLSVLRKAWLNLDLVWAAALIATAGLTLILSVIARDYCARRAGMDALAEHEGSADRSYDGGLSRQTEALADAVDAFDASAVRADQIGGAKFLHFVGGPIDLRIAGRE